jgi:Permease family
MYANGYCPVDDTGTKLACPQAYGALVGTAAVCSLVEIALSFLPPRALQRIFPPIVTGPTVLLIGVDLIGSAGFTAWAGGSGLCDEASPPAFFAKCPDITAPHALPWGSAQFIGRNLGKWYHEANATRPWVRRLPHHYPPREIWFPYHEVCQRHRWSACWLHHFCCLRLFRPLRCQVCTSRLIHLGPHIPIDHIRATCITHDDSLRHLRL